MAMQETDIHTVESENVDNGDVHTDKRKIKIRPCMFKFSCLHVGKYMFYLYKNSV